MPQPIPNPLLPSAPASPPTPAPSPTPHQRPAAWHEGPERLEHPILSDARLVFGSLDTAAKEAWLTSLVDGFDNHTLSFLHRLVSPKLKKDPFAVLPDELCLRVLEYVDDPKTFVRASSVSRRWRELVSDDQAWKALYDKHEYRRMSADSVGSSFANNIPTTTTQGQWGFLPRSASPPRSMDNMSSIDENSVNASDASAALPTRKAKRPRPKSTHRSRFKHRYMVESAWRKGGRMKAKHITPDQGVVTSLHLTKKYIVVALDNAKIHVFDTQGEHLRTLQGHVMGVWAMVPWDDILVSGGCDRDVRVWDMATGYDCKCAYASGAYFNSPMSENVDRKNRDFRLQGHYSTCLGSRIRYLHQRSDGPPSQRSVPRDPRRPSGSDGSVRVWSLNSYNPIHRLAAHDNSVTSLQFDDLRIVSGGSDGRVKIWDLSTGSLIRELSQPAEAVWRVAFESERCVVMASRTGRTIMEVWDFTPPAEDEDGLGLRGGALSTGVVLPPDEVLVGQAHVPVDQAMLDMDDDNMDGLESKENEEMMDAYVEEDDENVEQGEHVL
ncbi:MAG: hypothetical protein LQ345_002381 [Seirophora villosa]|nr:MAG: hypothetical protein LQ345_002381 [Seirophora villosa]